MRFTTSVLAVSLLSLPVFTVPQSATTGPIQLKNWRMHYADNFADYIFRFQSANRYELVFVRKSSSPPEAGARAGTFTYKRTSKTTAVLTLDKDEKWTLTFDKPNRASAKQSGDARTRIFFFEDPN